MPDLTSELFPELAIPHYDPRAHPHAIPEVGIFDEPVVNLCINTRWIGHISGMVERLAWEDAWLGTDTEKEAAIQEILKFLNACGQSDNIGACNMACCNSGAGTTRYRQNANGSFSVSHDSGQTFNDLPAVGSPFEPSFYYPLATAGQGGDVRCNAANAVVSWLKLVVNEYHQGLVDVVTVAALGVIFEGLLTLIGLAPFTVWGAIGSTLGLIAAQRTADDFANAFTSGLWQSVLCSFYCGFNDGGEITDADITNARTDVLANFPGTAGEFISAALGAITAKTAQGMYGAGFRGTLNCADCNCGDCLTGWTMIPTPTGGTKEIVGGKLRCTTSDVNTDGKYYMTLERDNSADCCTLISVTIVSGGASPQWAWIDCGDTNPTNWQFGLPAGHSVWRFQFRFNEATVVDVEL